MAAGTAWFALAAVQRRRDDEGAGAVELAADVVGDAVDSQVRARLAAMFASHASRARWSSWLARRAQRRRMCVHTPERSGAWATTSGCTSVGRVLRIGSDSPWRTRRRRGTTSPGATCPLESLDAREHHLAADAFGRAAFTGRRAE